MYEEGEQGRAHRNAPRACADGSQNAIDGRVEQAGIRDDAEIEDGKDEHAGHGRHVANALNDESARLQAKAANERGDNRNRDQGNQRRQPAARDGRQKEHDGREPEDSHHCVSISKLSNKKASDLPWASRLSDSLTPPSSTPSRTKFSAPNLGNT